MEVVGLATRTDLNMKLVRVVSPLETKNTGTRWEVRLLSNIGKDLGRPSLSISGDNLKHLLPAV